MTFVLDLRRAVIAALAATMLISAVQAAEPASEDPAAQAATYAKEAADLRASADKHAKIAKMHRSGAGPSKISHQSIAEHCERLAEKLRAAADESDAIAATYRGLAEKQ
jgi:hypothetical protein